MTTPLALVTGASRGIGRAISTLLATRGYDLILVAREENPLERVAEEISSNYGVNVSCIAVDITDFEAVRTRVNSRIGDSGRLDVLVNSAGIFRFGTRTLATEDLDKMFATNVTAAHNLCALCADAIKASGKGHIINISSVAGLEGFAPIGGYSASKFALVGYGQSLARELLGENVRVTTLCPDVVDTDMSKGSALPSELMIAPDDIAKAVDFVLSLSPSAIVEELVIRCKAVIDMTHARV
ncbi:3-oxoacyl-[acyl-carrier-protein] reductase FabG [Paraburkholderia caffeinitolerans]|uniref:3-oxoacyl-[acyl-carrier-protein] reductase FabG n=1 Tax=Paraburkholderia caffeinitolerans TaxID=1723730 RepID=A0A6J5GH85_9BURK|nr:SDR family oxidoreductase [Paraburkholderia caffeinitolerans]CAB3800785.1 3-oxoacyl-[acyl-carrier-protein] reductase FabG [Paraburkholderia caffeinitolerans]